MYQQNILPGAVSLLLVTLLPATTAWKVSLRTGSVLACAPALNTDLMLISGITYDECHNIGDALPADATCDMFRYETADPPIPYWQAAGCGSDLKKWQDKFVIGESKDDHDLGGGCDFFTARDCKDGSGPIDSFSGGSKQVCPTWRQSSDSKDRIRSFRCRVGKTGDGRPGGQQVLIDS